MPRTIVDIPAELLAAVDPLCATLDISRAEAVRRGLIEFLRAHEADGEDGFGLWNTPSTKALAKPSPGAAKTSAQQPSGGPAKSKRPGRQRA